MNKNVYSNKEFTDLIDKLNQEILRRGTYKWWDPLTKPSVGQDRVSPIVIPDDEGILVDDKTYTINNPSTGSIEETRNIDYPAHGINPAGKEPEIFNDLGPNTSAAALNSDELKNLLVGLTKIQDVNLFYGRDELPNTAFRDPNGIEEALENAANSELNSLLKDSDIPATKVDPNAGIKDHRKSDETENIEVTYPFEDGKYVMPSGEHDGEEVIKFEGLGPTNFYDDYGAQPGDGHFHPFNRFTSPLVNRDKHNQDNQRKEILERLRLGGISSARFGANPRNPEMGDPYPSREVYGGKEGACNVACTGLCFMTCDNECSESCTSTCWDRCGEACTASCGNVCTGCSTLCYSSCKTKCENSTGYACVKAGAKTVKITSTGGKDGKPAENHISYEIHTCDGCSFSCQFYPNKKTECWDAACMGKCFTSCNTACSTSCFGGCIDNQEQNSDNSGYRNGKGRGCSSGCTLNCIGLCSGTCINYCTTTCWDACKSQCSDNCSYTCATFCGAGCAQGCTDGCKGCSLECSGGCSTVATDRTCIGCGAQGGCTSNCQFDCNKNCMGWGCRSLCGIDNAGSCEANCRISCVSSSCTSMCSDACASQCTTCVNTCGFQCGSCSSMCSVGCGEACNITCTEECSNGCSDNCVHSCTEKCGGCSNLCYSCVGMCIGVCSVKCENGCSSCAGQCSWWCDSSCSRECFADCISRCINTCSGSCSTHLFSETTNTIGAERKPIAEGYIYSNPKNRWEERESFRLVRTIAPYVKPGEVKPNYLVIITLDEDKNIKVIRPEGISYITRSTTVVSGVWQVDSDTGEITVDEDMLNGLIESNKPSIDGEDSLFIVILTPNEDITLSDDDIGYDLPFGFTVIKPYAHISDGSTVVIIAREHPEYFPGEEDYDDWHKDFHNK